MKKTTAWDMKNYVKLGALCFFCLIGGRYIPEIIEKNFKNFNSQAPVLKENSHANASSQKQNDQSFSQKAFEQKLKTLKSNIIAVSPQDRQYIELLLDEMAKVPTGQKRIMQASNDIKFQKVDIGEIPGDALYLATTNTCYISDMHKNTDLNLNKSDYCFPAKFIAHELLHARQHVDGRFNFTKSTNPYKDFSITKLNEMETFVQDTIFETEWYKQDPNRKLTANAQFYMSELNRYKQQGLSDKEAQALAKTNLVKILWSNCTDLPDGCTVSDQLKKGINVWNQIYDLQTVTNSTKFQSNAKPDQEEKRADTIFARYIQEMGVKLPTDYFHKTLKKCLVIQPKCVTSIQSDHSKNYEIRNEDDHFTVCKYAKKTGEKSSYISELTSYNSGCLKDGSELLCDSDGKLKAIKINNNGHDFATCLCDKNGNVASLLVDFQGISVLAQFKGGQYPQTIGLNGTTMFVCNDKNGDLLVIAKKGDKQLSSPKKEDKKYVQGLLGIILDLKNTAQGYKKTLGLYNPQIDKVLATKKSRE